MRRLQMLAAAGLLVMCAIRLPAAEPDELQRVLDKVLKAKGDPAQFAKLQALTRDVKATVYWHDVSVPYSGSDGMQGMSRLWFHIRYEIRGKSYDVLSALNGDLYWIVRNGKKQKASPKELALQKQLAQIDYITSLGVLRDRSLPIKCLPERQLDGEIVMVLEVMANANIPVRLYFDKQSALLVRSEHREEDEETGEQILQETFYTNYQTVRGIRYYTRSWVRQRGMKRSECEYTNLKPSENLDDRQLAEPR